LKDDNGSKLRGGSFKKDFDLLEEEQVVKIT